MVRRTTHESGTVTGHSGNARKEMRMEMQLYTAKDVDATMYR